MRRWYCVEQNLELYFQHWLQSKVIFCSIKLEHEYFGETTLFKEVINYVHTYAFEFHGRISLKKTHQPKPSIKHEV
jgi:hypothetical protein